MKNTNEVRHCLLEEIGSLRGGKSTPARANAVCNLVGKVLASAKLDIEYHRYVQKVHTGSISVPLLEQKPGNKRGKAEITK